MTSNGTPLVPPAERPRLMFVEEVAERLGRTPAALRWMVNQGTAPKHAKIGGRICWRESDVEAFIEAAFADAS